MKKIIFFISLLFLLPAHTIICSTDSGVLWLVNAENRLDEAYVPPGLAKYAGFQMRSEIVEPFKSMTAAMKADGVTPPHIQSAYRDYRHQRHLFTQKENFYANKGYGAEDAADLASQTVAYPGASEHQSGLALDVTTDGMLRQTFGETPQGVWLDEHSHEYGFIVRYPQNKTNVTGIIYEPWHFRYVGVPHASFMKEKDFCFEEYLEYLKLNRRLIFHNPDGSYYLMFYRNMPISVEEMSDYIYAACSSDRKKENAGFIITLLKTTPGMLK